MPDPIYTHDNCRPAYQLRWSLALFANQALPPVESWRPVLSAAVERDHVRLLDVTVRDNRLLFLLSTTPAVIPQAIVKSVKGRLQHLWQSEIPQAFRRNFSLASLGDAGRSEIEGYVASQLEHHLMADERVQTLLSSFQVAFPQVDLSEPYFSSHGRYLCNLHLVLVHDGRWCEVREDRLRATRDMFVRAAQSKRHRLSRLALLADHLHATLGFRHDESPQEVALSYLNNLAFAHGMTAMYQHGYYVGTFGEYDMDAVR